MKLRRTQMAGLLISGLFGLIDHWTSINRILECYIIEW